MDLHTSREASLRSVFASSNVSCGVSQKRRGDLFEGVWSFDDRKFDKRYLASNGSTLEASTVVSSHPSGGDSRAEGCCVGGEDVDGGKGIDQITEVRTGQCTQGQAGKPVDKFVCRCVLLAARGTDDTSLPSPVWSRTTTAPPWTEHAGGIASESGDGRPCGEPDNATAAEVLAVSDSDSSMTIIEADFRSACSIEIQSQGPLLATGDSQVVIQPFLEERVKSFGIVRCPLAVTPKLLHPASARIQATCSDSRLTEIPVLSRSDNDKKEPCRTRAFDRRLCSLKTCDALPLPKCHLFRIALLISLLGRMMVEELRVSQLSDIAGTRWRAYGAVPVCAFGDETHRAIGRTVMSALKARALAQTKRLLNGKDVVDVSSWGHRVASKYKLLEELHFQAQPDGECKEVREDYHCPNGFCLLKGVEHFYKRLTREGEPPELNFPSGIRLTDADALKYLITLLGDMHQPLHFGRLQDDFGRKHMGTLPDSSTGQRKESSLYRVWDNDLIDRLATSRPVFWNGGWTHVNNVKAVFEREKKLFAENKSKQFKAWANESLQLLCRSIRNDGSEFRLSNPFTVTPKMEETWMSLVKTQILVAGARIAIVLNSILEAREASALRQGSGVQDVGVDGDESSGGGMPAWLRNLLTNLLIIAIVLSLLVYVTRFYSSGASPGRAQRQHGDRDGATGNNALFEKELASKAS